MGYDEDMEREGFGETNRNPPGKKPVSNVSYETGW